ncbi:hypothetical protein LOC71_19185 [Rhodopirellula sp. JC740]|uniref:Uncharacterized protein n=1 Tax=Rhodopirellula halodulae TaxID=2894198 RepID=A0ABS8NLI6_9BACT|nr:hypothetical protein [Rhodopirellula sp. JC740]MCC9644402.1 hypothetical protein [Rhodopirellula sp. JC740]
MRLGRRYNAEKADAKTTLKRGDSPRPQRGDGKGRTVERIAKEEGVSKNTVERAAARMEVHDAVEKVDPEVASAALETPSLKQTAKRRFSKTP